MNAWKLLKLESQLSIYMYMYYTNDNIEISN